VHTIRVRCEKMFSVYFRWRIVWLSVVHGKSPAAISSLLGICERTARRYLDSFQRTGDVLPKKHRSGSLSLLGEFIWAANIGETLLLVRKLKKNYWDGLVYPFSLVPRPSSLVEKGRGRPGRTYHVTDVTDCGQFWEPPTHSEHANTGLPKLLHLLHTQGGQQTSAAVQQAGLERKAWERG
jgi:hypothetical protein